MHRLGIAGISNTYCELNPAPVIMLILFARVICAISICTRCWTESDWFSQGQDALEDEVVVAVPVDRDAVAPAAGDNATAATGNASAKVADAAIVRVRLLR
jgi:hypothetical protein